MTLGHIFGWAIYLVGAVTILQLTTHYWLTAAAIMFVLVGDKMTREQKRC
jgi:hypothetical protein